MTTLANTNATDIDAVQTSLATLTGNLPSASGTINSHTTQLAILTSNVNTNASDIDDQGEILETLQPSSVLTVAPAGANYTTIAAAIAAAITNGVDDDNPMIVKVAPGIYDVTEAMTIPEGLTLLGASRKSTVVKFVGTGDDDFVFILSNDSHLENLTVWYSDADAAGGIGLNNVSASASVRRVIIEGGGDAGDVPLELLAGTLTVQDVSIGHVATGAAIGVRVASGSMIVSELQALVYGDSNTTGILVEGGGDLDIRDSDISANDSAPGGGSQVKALSVVDSGSFAAVSNTKLSASTSASGRATAVFSQNVTTVELLGSKVTCSGSATGLGCLYALNDASITVNNSKVKAITNQPFIFADDATIKVANSLSDGSDGSTANGGTVLCGNVVNGDYQTVISASCS